MNVLVEEARAPGAARAEVNALIAGLSQPLPSDASPRERADLLLSLMEDAQLASYTGTDGRTVRVAAIQALLALGYPYALEVPPEALEARARDVGTGPGLLSTRKGQVGFGLVSLAGIVQMLPVPIFADVLSWDVKYELWRNVGVFLAFTLIGGTTFVPALLMVLGHKKRRRGLKGLGATWLILASLLWLIPGLLWIDAFPLNLFPIAMGGLILAGALLMSSKND